MLALHWLAFSTLLQFFKTSGLISPLYICAEEVKTEDIFMGHGTTIFKPKMTIVILIWVRLNWLQPIGRVGDPHFFLRPDGGGPAGTHPGSVGGTLPGGYLKSN